MDEAPATAPITWSQQSIWSLHRQIEADPTLATFYNFCDYLRLDHPLPRALIAKALDHLFQRHESLRTTFQRHAGGPALQVVTPDGRPRVEFHQEHELIARHRSMESFVDHTRATVLRPSLAPPAEFHVVCQGDSVVGVVALVHHLCADAMGLHALAEDFGRVCKDLVMGRPIRKPNPGIPPLAQSHRENSPSGRGTSERSLEHWKQTFTIPTVAPALPAGRAPGNSCDGILTSYRLSRAVPGLARTFGLTSGEVILTLFAAVVSTFTGLPTCRITCLCSNRAHDGMSVSCSFQMTPVLFDLRTAETFEDAVGVMKENRQAMMTFAQYDHNRRVTETLLAQERTGHNLAHRIEYNYIARRTASGRAAADDSRPSEFRWMVGRREPMPDLLNLAVTDDPEKTQLCVSSDTSVTDREELERLLYAIEDIATSLARDPHRPLAELTGKVSRQEQGRNARLSAYHGGFVDLDHARQVIAEAVGGASPVAVFVESRHQPEDLVAYVARDMAYLELHRLRRLLLERQYDDPGLVVPTWLVSCAGPPDAMDDHTAWRALETLALPPGGPPPLTEPGTEQEEALSSALRRHHADAVVNLEISYVECGGRLETCEDVVEQLIAAGYTGITPPDFWNLTPLRLLARRLTRVGPPAGPVRDDVLSRDGMPR
ncbi:condensation domain-containing protein [Streptomyces sp. SBT349]|uniref:condensation domain-containing protein n=1 Tax=Streptomyces sp. SBT349 TaxID=1580539 RepID=UPI000ADE6864|nr:condensation domain-containing protein [Streptomyces sp. SBT349]